MKAFHEALQGVYFDGRRMGHSLVSGLILIERCRTDKTHKGDGYNGEKALIACEVAALSMLFHDQRCRERLSAADIKPIAFEELPYAAILMFADALQHDRRDFEIATWPSPGVLRSLEVDTANGTITATVSLADVPTQYWPSVIVEFASVTDWINELSKMKFKVDFLASTGTTEA